MKIIVSKLSEKALEKREWQDAVIIEIDGKRKFEASDGEIEDNNLSRNFSDVYRIPQLLEMAYKAGKDGEEFNIQYKEMEKE